MDQELKDYLQAMEIRLRDYIDERTHDAETRIVRAFGADDQQVLERGKPPLTN